MDDMLHGRNNEESDFFDGFDLDFSEENGSSDIAEVQTEAPDYTEGIDLTSFDFADIEPEVDIVDAEENDLIEDLQLLDYQGIFNLDKESLQKLKEHADAIANTNTQSIKDLLNGIYDNTYTSLMESIATDPLTEDIVGGLDTNVTANYTSSNIDSDVNMQMRTTITELILNKNASSVTPNVVLNVLINKEIITIKDLEENQDRYIDYLQMLIPAMITYCNNTLRKSGLKKIQREDTTQYLLREDKQLLNKALNSELVTIKQIFVNGGSKYCYCQKCNNKVTLDGPALSYIVYATDTSRNDIIDPMFETKRGSNATLLPRVHYCSSCSVGSILSPYDLSVLIDPLRKYMYKGANRFAQNSVKYGRGTSVTRAEVSFSTIQSILEYLYVVEVHSEEELIGVLNAKTSIDLDTDVVQIAVDTHEMKVAAEQFYKKLIGKKPIKRMKTLAENTVEEVDVSDSDSIINRHENTVEKRDSLTYKELAIHLSLNLARDYNKLKNQALFSLLFMFNETVLIEDILDMRKVWSNKALLKFIEALPKNADSLSEAEKSEIMVEYEKWHPDTVGVSITEKYNFICSLYNDLQNKLVERAQSREKFIQELEENADMLAYTKIINLNQYKVAQIHSLIADERLLKLLDDVTDRMIINNLAEDFYDIYTRTNIFNLNKIKTTMESSVAETLIQNLGKMFDKVTENYFDKTKKLPRIYDYGVSSKFDNVSYLSNNSLLCVKELYDAFRDADYYRFIEAIGNIKDVDDSIISGKMLQKLKQIIDLAEKDSEVIGSQSYLQFYLKDFSTEELEAMNFVDKQRADRIKFGLYVPKRLDSETLSEYLDRYEELRQNKAFYKVECYNYTAEFTKFIDYYANILLCASITGMSYKSYVKAAFISALCGIAAEDINRDFGLYLFAVNDRMLAREQDGCRNFVDYHSIVSQGEKMYGVSYGYYSSFISERANELLKEYEERLITSSTSLNAATTDDMLKKFLQDILLADDNTIILEESKYQASKKTDMQDLELVDIDVAEFKDTTQYTLAYYCGSDIGDLL